MPNCLLLKTISGNGCATMMSSPGLRVRRNQQQRWSTKKLNKSKMSTKSEIEVYNLPGSGEFIDLRSRVRYSITLHWFATSCFRKKTLWREKGSRITDW
jgi:hypothetical protein